VGGKLLNSYRDQPVKTPPFKGLPPPRNKKEKKKIKHREPPLAPHLFSSEDYHNIIIPYSTIITIVIILHNYE
jgi:hypothetical protein